WAETAPTTRGSSMAKTMSSPTKRSVLLVRLNIVLNSFSFTARDQVSVFLTTRLQLLSMLTYLKKFCTELVCINEKDGLYLVKGARLAGSGGIKKGRISSRPRLIEL